jgi:hypothetical protein
MPHKESHTNPALSAWRRACKSLGYTQPGESFKAVPKKGTAAYKKLYKEYKREL